MATGKLQIQVTSQLRAAPVEDAVIDISSTGEPDQILEEVRTDSVGQTDTLELEAPPEEYSLSPGEMQPYSEYNFRITAPGYEPLTISGGGNPRKSAGFAGYPVETARRPGSI